MRFRTASLGASIAMLVAACALIADIPDAVTVAAPDGSAASRCEKPIRIHLLSTLNSPTVADVALPFYLGALDHLREIKETGGIRGCPLEWEVTPTDFADPGKALQAYEDWKRRPEWNEVVAIFGVSSADAIALGDHVTDDKRVLISTAYNGTLASPKPVSVPVDVPETTFVPGPPTTMNETVFRQEVGSKGFPYVFFPGTDYSTAMRIAMYHIRTVEPGARVGWVHCSTNEFCTNPLAAGKSYAKENGLEIGRDIRPELTDDGARYGALLLPYFLQEATHALANPGYRPVSWLWSGNLTLGTFLLATALGQLQAAPKPDESIDDGVWTKVHEIIAATKILANNYGFDESLAVSLCPSRLGGMTACQRIFGIMPFLAFGDNTGSTEMPRLVALHDKWRQRDVGEPYNDAAAIVAAGLPVPPTRSVRYVQGHMNVKLFKLGMERVIDQNMPINGESLKVALESFRSVDTGGLTAPLSFSADDHRPQSTVTIYGLDFGDEPTGGTKRGLKNIPPTRRIAPDGRWLGW